MCNKNPIGGIMARGELCFLSGVQHNGSLAAKE
jgi:hypothetical protein